METRMKAIVEGIESATNQMVLVQHSEDEKFFEVELEPLGTCTTYSAERTNEEIIRYNIRLVQSLNLPFPS